MATTSPLRRRMIEDMTVRNLSRSTQQSYIYAALERAKVIDPRARAVTLELLFPMEDEESARLMIVKASKGGLRHEV